MQIAMKGSSSKDGAKDRSKASGSSGRSSGKHLRSEVGSIVLFALCIFTLCALVTYNSADPSFFSNSHSAAQNACGRMGAYLSSALLQTFGLGAFLLPAAIGFVAAIVHKREGSVRVVGTLGGMTVAVISLTVFVTLQWKYWPFSGTLLLTGGAFGAWLAEILVRQFNALGSSIVTLLVFCLALALSTPLSVARFGGRILGIVGTLMWRLTRLATTYLVFVGSLVAMRVAHALGDGIQRLIEGAIRRAKERATLAAQAAEQRNAEAQAAQVVEIPGTIKGELVTATVIGPDEVLKKSTKNAGADEDESENDADDDSGDEDAIDISALKSPLSVNGSEAPNVLPELEENGEPIQKSLALRGTAPMILPREHTGAEATAATGEDTLTHKVANKLQKMASRSRNKGNWKLPSVEFLKKPPKVESAVDREKLLQNSQILKQKFADFGIDGEVTAVRPGPVITLYEFKPGPGIKVSRIASLADDLSMALSAQSVRILAPLPGKSVVGIEIPSDVRETVYMREFLQNADFHSSKFMIPIAMGKDIAGQTYLSDLYRMPHLMCAGQTGSGKSVFMNGLICSLFYRFTPDELRVILIDPKFIEFRAYQEIPHLLLPVVDDAKHASTALKWAVREMERRYRILAKIGARNLASFNQKVDEMGVDVVSDLLLAEENQGESMAAPVSGSDWIEAFEPDDTGAPKVGKLPYIVIIIDELADLMMIAKKEVEISIARIAQKARAAGIHLVIATQRPSTDVITGLIKANLPSRASFQLASFVDSKTILDRAGAERLLGQGDMLFIPPGVSSPVRLHGAYLDDEEIAKITGFLKSQGKPAYREEILLADEEDSEGEGGEEDDADELFDEAVELVKRSGTASASFLQRHLKVGYNRAARMIENMENRGIVGPADGARPREVLIR
jgi:DNA segregation ATPase FtsK/SpoIIIE-like protein